MVKQIVNVTEEDNFLIDFPILGFNIPDTKKAILEQIRSRVTSVAAIAVNVGISNGLAYNHLRELSYGIHHGQGWYAITDAGKIAVI